MEGQPIENDGDTMVEETAPEPARKKKKARPKKTANPTKPPKKPLNGRSKVGVNLTAETGRKVRRLRAELELETGEAVTISEAIDRAVSQILE